MLVKIKHKVFLIMIRSHFIVMLLTCVVCSFCGQDFVTHGRHSWRCKQRTNQDQSRSTNTEREMPALNNPNVPITQRTVIKCCCGKVCKGNRGLKMHQRSCQVLHGLNNDLCADLEEQFADNQEVITANDQPPNAQSTLISEEIIPDLKKDINLPKKDSEWKTANEYFKFVIPLNGPIMSQDFNSSIRHLNDTIYNYFFENFGNVESLPDIKLVGKYKDHSIKDLKKTLCDLKHTNSDVAEIEYVSRILRKKLRNLGDSQTQTDSNFNHDKYIERSFWGYVKNVLNRGDTVFPSFSMTECIVHFTIRLLQFNQQTVSDSKLDSQVI